MILATYALLAFLAVLATARLTRFIVSDSLGRWLTGPLRRWARRHEDNRIRAVLEVRRSTDRKDLDLAARLYLDDQVQQIEDEEPVSWQARLVSGLDCPFCVGFWIGLAVIVLTVVLYPLPIVGQAWVILLAALAMNYVVAHVSSRID